MCRILNNPERELGYLKDDPEFKEMVARAERLLARVEGMSLRWSRGLEFTASVVEGAEEVVRSRSA